MYKTKDIRIELNDNWQTITTKVVKKSRLSEKNIAKMEYAKRSLDARNKQDIFYICSFYVWLGPAQQKIDKSLLMQEDEKRVYATIPMRTLQLPKRPIVVGFGPCGMFIGLYLAKAGCRPIIIEQGQPVEKRVKDIASFFKTGELQMQSNIQFGEGGAGTFSDGKLTTSKKDEQSKIIINELIAHGAPLSIFYENKPHMGTDNLVRIVKNMRENIVALGGEILFDHQFIDFQLQQQTVTQVTIAHQNQEFTLACDDLFLACGHSARSTFELLYKKKIALAQKPFAIGVRIEHLQAQINQSQYGNLASSLDGKAADYKLVNLLSNKRTAYTFCMCPGGSVVNASSEEGGVCCNGMSQYKRNGDNANSAILITVDPRDFASDHPLAGIDFQRSIEQKVFAQTHKYQLPVQTVGNFLKQTENRIESVKPSCKGSYYMADLTTLLPDFIVESLQEALLLFDKKLKGFAHVDSLLVGVETRSSSPLWILRDRSYQSLSVSGLYPCGEGSGYAGGIITSALDGLKCVESVLRSVYNIEL